jgi:hypothetical protein
MIRPSRFRKVVSISLVLMTSVCAACGSNSEKHQQSRQSSHASCIGLINFNDVHYQLLFIYEQRSGRKLGEASAPSCNDVAGDSTPSRGRTEKFSVFQLRGIDADVAVLVAAGEPTLAVAAGRCAGFKGEAFFQCLKRPLQFAGSTYTATRLVTSLPRQRVVGSGTLAGCCTTAARAVRVVSLKDVPVSRAVAIAGDRRGMYVAYRKCMVVEARALRTCLRRR